MVRTGSNGSMDIYHDQTEWTKQAELTKLTKLTEYRIRMSSPQGIG